MSGYRLSSGGLIDRNRRLAFEFNGSTLSGYHGDTLASALLGAGVQVIGRGFKTRRPRGIVSAGSEEPNAFVDIGAGAEVEPNVRATQIELSQGLVARATLVREPIDRLIGWIGRQMPPGFYYKTFMWPRWSVFEAAIRRQAHQGLVPNGDDPRIYLKRRAFCDVLVIGAGVAGLNAAVLAARSGLKVLLLEEQADVGGALRWDEVDERAAGHLAELRTEVEQSPSITVRTRTAAVGYYDHNFIVAVEYGPGPERTQCLWKIRTQYTVLATGAVERWLAIPNNDLPGVMLSASVRRYVREFAVCPGHRIVIFAAHDDGYRTARALASNGCPPLAIVDPRPAHDLGRSLAADLGVRVLFDSMIENVRGTQAVRAVDISSHGSRSRPSSITLSSDCVAVAGGWNPNVALFAQSGGSLVFDRALGAFRAAGARQLVHMAGAADGHESTQACAGSGRAAMEAILRGEPLTAPTSSRASHSLRAVSAAIWRVPAPRSAERRMWVDLRHDVTVRDIAISIQENFSAVEHFKRYTTTGMGPDQGKLGNPTALALLAQATGRSLEEVGTPTYRPPLQPLTLGAIADAWRGELYRPLRRLPAHDIHVERGAIFEDYAGWQRPVCFPRQGEDEASAVSREVRSARSAIAMYDASSLGKIWIKGPDAAKFLNRVYATAVGSMPVGRVRYSFMLDDNGIILDDGVCARISEELFLASPTSARSARVYAWLEEWHQTEWPELDLVIEAATSGWATFSVVGPRARELLGQLDTDISFSNDRLPHMSLAVGQIRGVPARVARVSFTGELSFEISVPAQFGASVWAHLLELGSSLQIETIGIEAVNVLRLEKAYLEVGTDTDSTTTPMDIGWGAPLDKRTDDFIGRRALQRADARREDRRQLVGLRAKDNSAVLPVGGHVLFVPGRSAGFVTSSRWSPSLGHGVALALVEGGRMRIGEEVRVSTGVVELAAKVVEPAFFDPAGDRLRG